MVDQQVQAIWTALVNEYRLQYINPPPAYSQRSQRLRTPSEISHPTRAPASTWRFCSPHASNTDIYPVVVLLTGHAFVGYWRSEDAHDSLVSSETVPP